MAAARRGALVELPQAATPEEQRGPCLGRLVGWSAERGPMVDFPGNPQGPLPARTTVPLDAGRVERALRSGGEVLLSHGVAGSEGPIIVGLLEPRPASGAPASAGELEALVDGRRVVLDARDEIVLRCGKASITLRRNGRVVVRGTFVETCSAGVNRIKGGQVKIN